MARWHDIKPKGLSKHDAKNPWVFAVYWESADEREDGRDYEAFLFRDEARATFGVIERSEWTHLDKHCERAAWVVRDVKYRASLVSDDPSLVERWRGH